jgi:hypothetical protein
MFRGSVCCHFRFATCHILTLRWYEAVIFVLWNVLTARNILVIENSCTNLILLLLRSEKRFPMCKFLLTIHNINYILQNICSDNAALFNGRASGLIAQMQIISMAKYLKFVCVIRNKFLQTDQYLNNLILLFTKFTMCIKAQDT